MISTFDIDGHKGAAKIFVEKRQPVFNGCVPENVEIIYTSKTGSKKCDANQTLI